MTRWTLGAALLGLLTTSCNPSPHLDPPGSTSSSGGAGTTSGSGGASGGAAGSASTSSGATGGGGSGGAGGCASNAGCSYPNNLCDVAAGKCVECLVSSDCSAKPGTVCSKAACVCPIDAQTFCAQDGYGPARCADHSSSSTDCGACGHVCYGSCMGSTCVDAWEPIAKVGAPSGRTHHVAVWSGTAMIVWGGFNAGQFLGDGAMYDPDKRVWTPMSTANAPSPREYATAVWTGTKMIVWGGRNSTGPLSDGAAFDPAANAWSNLSNTGNPAARYRHTAL